MGELVRHGPAAQDRPVLDIRLPGQGHVAHQDTVAADVAVMGDMDIGHHQGVAVHLGHELAAGLRAAVDGGTLADGHPVTDLHVGDLAFEFQVLRDGADDRTGEHRAVLAHLDVGEDGGMRKDLAAVTDLDIVVDKGERTDFNAFPELRAGADDGQRMDLRIHSL